MLQRSQQLLSDRHVAEVSESPPCKRPTSKDHLFGQRKTRKKEIRGGESALRLMMLLALLNIRAKIGEWLAGAGVEANGLSLLLGVLGFGVLVGDGALLRLRRRPYESTPRRRMYQTASHE